MIMKLFISIFIVISNTITTKDVVLKSKNHSDILLENPIVAFYTKQLIKNEPIFKEYRLLEEFNNKEEI